MTKVSLLTIIAAIFAQSFNIGAACNEYRFSTQGYSQIFVIGEMMAYTSRAIEGFVNCTVLYLMFTFATSQYQFCCGKCHQCLYNTCLDSVTRNIRRQTEMTIAKKYALRSHTDCEMSLKLLESASHKI